MVVDEVDVGVDVVVVGACVVDVVVAGATSGARGWEQPGAATATNSKATASRAPT
jgi:hypothetical protein